MIGQFSISGLPAVKFDGIYRVLGCLPETAESKFAFPSFGAMNTAAPLDPSQWREIDLSWYKPTIKDQKATSSCVGFSSSSGMEMCWLQSGRPYQMFNPYFIYGLVNGGRDAGAMISDSLKALMNFGVCRQEFLPPGVMFQNQFPQTAFADAANYKLIQAYRCDTFEEICSAITLGFVCIFGIYVGDNFANLDSEGVAPLPAGGGGGHALPCVGLKKSSRYGWVIKFQNSWSAKYGLGGYGYVRKEHFRSMPPDAFAIQSMTGPDDTIPVVN